MLTSKKKKVNSDPGSQKCNPKPLVLTLKTKYSHNIGMYRDWVVLSFFWKLLIFYHWFNCSSYSCTCLFPVYCTWNPYIIHNISKTTCPIAQVYAQLWICHNYATILLIILICKEKKNTKKILKTKDKRSWFYLLLFYSFLSLHSHIGIHSWRRKKLPHKFKFQLNKVICPTM